MCLCLRGTKESGGEDGGACARDVSEIICSSWARTLAGTTSGGESRERKVRAEKMKLSRGLGW